MKLIEEYDFERTIALGERSIGYLKRYRTPAVPCHYELFYTYACGYNKDLNEAVRAIIAQQAQVTTAEAENLYYTFLSPVRHCDEMGEIGQGLIDAIDAILETAHCANSTTTAFAAALEILKDQLSEFTDAAQLQNVVRTVIAAAVHILDDYQQLERRLAGSKERIEELQHHLDSISAEAYTDPLTGVADRKRFDRELELAVHIASEIEQEKSLCLLMIDIDHFKRFNDTFGHQAGDSVLRLVARTMTANVKGRDLVARFGGEEFAVLLPMTTLEAAVAVANQIRQAVMENELVARGTGKSLGRIHLSVGVASYQDDETTESLIERADACLYAAKRRGRNRTVSERELDAGRVGTVDSTPTGSLAR